MPVRLWHIKALEKGIIGNFLVVLTEVVLVRITVRKRGLLGSREVAFRHERRRVSPVLIRRTLCLGRVVRLSHRYRRRFALLWPLCIRGGALGLLASVLVVFGGGLARLPRMLLLRCRRSSTPAGSGHVADKEPSLFLPCSRRDRVAGLVVRYSTAQRRFE